MTTAAQPASRPLASSRSSATPPPAILLGGAANALSVARSLGRSGVTVYSLNETSAYVHRSRFCRAIDVPVPHAGAEGDTWAAFLLGPEAERLRGAVLLSCSDAGIEMLAAHREALAERYLLDDSNPEAQLRVLNKLETYRAAVEAGVPTPGFWVVDSTAALGPLRDALTYPLIVKPRLSHIFETKTGRKLFVAGRFEELAGAVEAICATGTDCILMEMIPGPDDRLCSYFTYLDEEGRPLFRFTKRIIRRYPALRGTACYHVTDDIPEAAELGDRLFRHVGLRGLANVEFKRDERDGRLKLIEINARFVASDALVARSGIDLGRFVYNRITGGPLPRTDRFRVGVRMWDPMRDFQAYLEQRKQGGAMSFPGWLGSVLHLQTFPFFEWTDPAPALARLASPVLRKLGAR